MRAEDVAGVRPGRRLRPRAVRDDAGGQRPGAGRRPRIAFWTVGRPSYPALTLAPPGLDDDLREPHRIERVVPLLALADLAPANRGGPLGDAVAVRDHADQQLGGLVLRLVEADSARDLRAPPPEPPPRGAGPPTRERPFSGPPTPPRPPPHPHP